MITIVGSDRPEKSVLRTILHEIAHMWYPMLVGAVSNAPRSSCEKGRGPIDRPLGSFYHRFFRKRLKLCQAGVGGLQFCGALTGFNLAEKEPSFSG